MLLYCDITPRSTQVGKMAADPENTDLLAMSWKVDFQNFTGIEIWSLKDELGMEYAEFPCVNQYCPSPFKFSRKSWVV